MAVVDTGSRARVAEMLGPWRGAPAADHLALEAVLLRVSDVLDRCGDHDDAISLQTRALSLMSAEHSGFGELAMEPGADALRSPAPVALM